MNVTGTQQTGSSEFIFAIIWQYFNIKIDNTVIKYCSAIFPNFVFEVVQGSARVLNIEKTRKTRGG